MSRQAHQASADWIDEEPDARAVLGEVARLARRARKRWALVLAVAIIVEAGGAYYIGRRPDLFTARVVLLVIEPVIVAAAAPSAGGKIREEVQQNAFSNRNLLALMTRFHISDLNRDSDPEQALEGFRENIELDVWRNEFLDVRTDVPRSAHVSIEVLDGEPDRAYGVTRALADLVVDTAQSQRIAEVEATRAELEAEMAALNEQLRNRSLDAEKLELEMDRHNSPAKETALDMLHRARERVVQRLDAVRARRAAIDVAVAAERESMGLQFIEIESPMVPEPVRQEVAVRLALIVLGFVISLLFAGMTVGAIDDRLYDDLDVERIGLTVLATIPPVRGRSLRGRGRRERAASAPPPHAPS